MAHRGICPRSGATTPSGVRRRRSRRRSSSRPSRSSGSIWRCAPPAGRSARRRCWAIRRTGTTPSGATGFTPVGCSTCCRSHPRRPCSPPRRSSPHPSRVAGRAGNAAIPDLGLASAAVVRAPVVRGADAHEHEPGLEVPAVGPVAERDRLELRFSETSDLSHPASRLQPQTRKHAPPSRITPFSGRGPTSPWC